MKSSRFLYIIARGDAFGGSTRHVCDIGARLRKDGHEVMVLVGGEPSHEVPKRLARANVPFTCIPSLGRAIHPWKDLRALVALRREIAGFSPQLISTHASKGGFLGRLASVGAGVPVFYTPHCWSFVDGFPRRNLYRRIEKWMARLASVIVTVCEEERRYGLSQGVGTAQQTITIHNGVGSLTDVSPIVGGMSDRITVRIVMVGRFEVQKDQPLLLRALSNLLEHDWHLTLVGDGPEKDACVHAAESLGIDQRVTFAGYSSSVEKEQLGEQDLFVLATNWEGFPRSILEAMRAGLPVISSDVGGCAESVLHGINGLIVPQGDEEKLTEALERLISDRALRLQMGRRGFEFYREKYHFEAMYQAHLRLYEAVLDSLPVESLVTANCELVSR